jgi:small subunit ribosomal protein S11
MGKKKVVSKQENIAEGEEKQAKAAAKKSSKSIESGKIYIKVSFNNTIITVTDNRGNVVTWASAGSLGFAGPKKATPFAAQKIVAAIAEKIAKTGPFNVDVVISGVSVGRDSAIRSLVNHGFNVLSIKDATPVPHNGPRPKKPRRV